MFRHSDTLKDGGIILKTIIHKTDVSNTFPELFVIKQMRIFDKIKDFEIKVLDNNVGTVRLKLKDKVFLMDNVHSRRFTPIYSSGISVTVFNIIVMEI